MSGAFLLYYKLIVMNIVTTTALTAAQLAAIYRLWNSEYPAPLVYNSMAELEDYLSHIDDKVHHFATACDTSVVGWAMSFTRNDERWFAVIVDRGMQGKGVGGLLLDRLKADARVLCGWVSDGHDCLRQDGSQYNSPLPFYTANGFRTMADIRLETNKLSAVKIVWQRSEDDT